MMIYKRKVKMLKSVMSQFQSRHLKYKNLNKKVNKMKKMNNRKTDEIVVEQ